MRCIATKKKITSMLGRESFNAREKEKESDGRGERKTFDRGERTCTPPGHPVTNMKEKK